MHRLLFYPFWKWLIKIITCSFHKTVGITAGDIKLAQAFCASLSLLILFLVYSDKYIVSLTLMNRRVYKQIQTLLCSHRIMLLHVEGICGAQESDVSFVR